MTRCDLLRAGCVTWLGLGIAFGGLHAWTLLPPVIVYALLAIDGVARPRSGWLLPVVSHGSREKSEVALTFDDGPDPELTPRILDTLEAHRAHATFFVIGRWAEAHPQLVRRMLDEGHEVGNHSYAHPRLLNMRARRAMLREIERGREALRPLGVNIHGNRLYRPPMGLKNPALARIQRQLGLTVVAWSLHAGDTRKRDPQTVAGRVLERIRGGDIVLFHDGHDLADRKRRSAVAEALEQILPELSRRGLRSVTVSDLLDENREGAALASAPTPRCGSHRKTEVEA